MQNILAQIREDWAKNGLNSEHSGLLVDSTRLSFRVAMQVNILTRSDEDYDQQNWPPRCSLIVLSSFKFNIATYFFSLPMTYFQIHPNVLADNLSDQVVRRLVVNSGLRC